MKKLLFLFIPLLMNAASLKALLEYAQSNNDLVLSKTLVQKSKQKEVDSKQSAYYPTIDAGASYQHLDERTLGLAGQVYGAYAKIGFDIYDGGNKNAQLEQKKDEHKASSYDVDDVKIQISLRIMENFFSIKSLQSSLYSRGEAQKSLKVQLDRMNVFLSANLATKDDVDRLQAAYDTNIYEMESIKLEILTLKLNISLDVGKNVDILDDSLFMEDFEASLEVTDSIKSLEYENKALKNVSRSIESVYYPQLRVEDTYSLYGYNSTDAGHPQGVDNQNKIMLTANIRLYDNATLSHEQQAVSIRSQALSKQIEYKTQEQKMNYELAQARIKTSKIKITSAESALVSASSAFKTIEQKYTAGIVDNVVYLDALVSKTSSASLYEKSLNDLQIAYGKYYYHSGKNLEEFLSE